MFVVKKPSVFSFSLFFFFSLSYTRRQLQHPARVLPLIPFYFLFNFFPDPNPASLLVPPALQPTARYLLSFPCTTPQQSEVPPALTSYLFCFAQITTAAAPINLNIRFLTHIARATDSPSQPKVPQLRLLLTFLSPAGCFIS
jgi:hypothetical protein